MSRLVEHHRRSTHRAPAGCAARWVVCALVVLLAPLAAPAQQPVTTVLADFESDSVAVSIGAVTNTSAADCSATRAPLPARGSQSLQVEIGATQANASIACDLVFRVASPFARPTAAAVFAWVNDGEAWLSFRVRDGAGRIFETPPQEIREGRRWLRVSADLSPVALRRVSGATEPAAPQAPFEIAGVRIGTPRVGRQTVFVDDLEVDHPVRPEEALRGEFQFDRPTHLYEPGATAKAQLELENGSREVKLDLSVDFAWMRADGTVVARGATVVNLPSSGRDFRARQLVDVSQKLDQSGLYRVRVDVRSPRWNQVRTFETSVAVTPSNRNLPRGRALFFGLRSNLLREPPVDQVLEIQVAREIGAQLLMLDTSWEKLEPKPGEYRFDDLNRVLAEAGARDLAVLPALVEPPSWLTAGGPLSIETRQPLLLEALARHAGARIIGIQACSRDPRTPLPSSALAALRSLAAKQTHAPLVLPPPETAAGESAAPRLQITTGDALNDLALGDAASRPAAAPGWWLHRSAALRDAGRPADAWSVLRAYLAAAERGVTSLVWHDLRDDTADPRFADQMNGLLARDFSPRATLLGYATAAGMLSGLSSAGTPPGLSAEFDGRLFIGTNRQVLALWPRFTTALPAVVAPVSAAPGTLTAFDFARRPLALLRAPAGLLVPVPAEPFFITADYDKITTDPELDLRRPWLRGPRVALCGGGARLRVEVDAPKGLRNSFVQMLLPSDAPFASSLSSRKLSAAAGETATVEADLTALPGKVFESAAATLRFSIEGKTCDLPLRVRPLAGAVPLGATFASPGSAVGALRDPNPDSKAPSSAVFVAHEAKKLHLALALPESAAGAELRIGIAALGGTRATEVRITPERLTLPQGWSGRRETSGAQDLLKIEITPQALELPGFEVGQHLLLAIQREVNGQVVARWGSGLDGAGTPQDFNWLRLAER